MFYLAEPYEIINIEEKTEVKEGFTIEIDGYEFEYDRMVDDNGKTVYIFDNSIGTSILLTEDGIKVYGLSNVSTKSLGDFVIENGVLHHVTRGIGKYRTYQVSIGSEIRKITKEETDIKTVIMIDASGSLVCSDNQNRALIISKDNPELAGDYGLVWQTCVPFWE